MVNILLLLIFLFIYSLYIYYDCRDYRKWWKRACHLSCINNSKKIDKIYCFPGNAGTDAIAENIRLDINKFEEFKNFIFSRKKIDLVIVGPEKPLVDG